MSNVKELEEQLKAARAATAAKLAAKAEEDEPKRLQREIAYENAKQLALGTYDQEQLFEADVAAVGPCLLHWPDDITYDHFMKTSGALRGDMSQMSADKTENLIARCAIYPEPKIMLEQLRARNPHARTVITMKILEKMRGRLAEEGK